jgi:hypothetical protein
VDEPSPLPFPTAARDLLRCLFATAILTAGRRIEHPRSAVGRRLRFADGSTSWVYRETRIERPPAADPCVLVVEFRLRGVRRPWAHALFRLESWLNTPLFAGFPGLVSKWWVAADAQHVYRGVYDYDGPVRADRYARALWWVLALVSVRGSIRHRVLPGVRRADLLTEPASPGEPAEIRDRLAPVP